MRKKTKCPCVCFLSFFYPPSVHHRVSICSQIGISPSCWLCRHASLIPLWCSIVPHWCERKSLLYLLQAPTRASLWVSQLCRYQLWNEAAMWLGNSSYWWRKGVHYIINCYAIWQAGCWPSACFLSRSNSSHFQPDTKQTSPLHAPHIKSGVVNLLCWECFESSTTATLQIAQNDYASVSSLACAGPCCLIQIFVTLLCYRFECAYFR